MQSGCNSNERGLRLSSRADHIYSPRTETDETKDAPYTRAGWLILLRGSVPYDCGTGRFSRKTHIHPDTIPWGPAPPVVRPGAQFAVLEGDPTASSGDYTVRLKMPDGYPDRAALASRAENVTVISGTFKVGMGDIFDAVKMTALPAGSFGFLDPNMHHYAMTCGETIVQLHGKSHSMAAFTFFTRPCHLCVWNAMSSDRSESRAVVRGTCYWCGA